MMYLLYGLIILSVTAFDQFFKYWVVSNITLGGTKSFLPGIVSLTHIHNTGAAFSMFENMRWFLLIITFISIALIIIYMIKAKLTVLARLSLSMILGGAIGNAIDRVINGYVVDMFDLDFMEYAIFNVADCFIVIGGTIFCLYFIIDAYRDEKSKKRLQNDEYDDFTDEDSNILLNSAKTMDRNRQIKLGNTDSTYSRKFSKPNPIHVSPVNTSNSQDSFVSESTFENEAEFKMDPDSLAIFESDFAKNKEKVQNTEPISNEQNVISNDKTPSDNTTVIKLPSYELPVFKPQNHTRSKNSGYKSDKQKIKLDNTQSTSHNSSVDYDLPHKSLSESENDLSLTKKLDLDFKQIFEDRSDSENDRDN